MGQLNVRGINDLLLMKLRVYVAETGKSQREVVEEWLSDLRTESSSVRLSGGVREFHRAARPGEKLPDGHAPKLAGVVLSKVKGVKRGSELPPRNPKPANDDFEMSAADRVVEYEQD